MTGDQRDGAGPDVRGESGGTTDGPSTGADLHEAFSLVANETRFDILRALWNATREGDGPVQFSTLRERTGTRDSGQFNYHLDKLVPRFVRKRADGYELSYAGKQVVGAAVSGAYTDAEVTVVEPIPVGECPDCGGRLAGTYEDGEMEVRCDDCGLCITDGLAAPPVIAATHDKGDLPAVFSRYMETQVETMNQGFCPLCGGGVDRSLTRLADADPQFGDASAPEQSDVDDGAPVGDMLDILYTCGVCGFEAHGVVGTVLASEPVVTAFLVDQGIDVGDRLVWEFDWLYDTQAEIASEDPVRVEATLAVDDARLRLTLDGDLDVVDHERS
jgi:predicted RNA-binding Zn-ribbon protein involved in translation (DUF1610 family)